MMKLVWGQVSRRSKYVRERERDSAAPSRFAGPRSRSQQACFPPEAEVTWTNNCNTREPTLSPAWVWNEKEKKKKKVALVLVWTGDLWKHMQILCMQEIFCRSTDQIILQVMWCFSFFRSFVRRLSHRIFTMIFPQWFYHQYLKC